jgi:hypothetical protein
MMKPLQVRCVFLFGLAAVVAIHATFPLGASAQVSSTTVPVRVDHNTLLVDDLSATSPAWSLPEGVFAIVPPVAMTLTKGSLFS